MILPKGLHQSLHIELPISCFFIGEDIVASKFDQNLFTQCLVMDALKSLTKRCVHGLIREIGLPANPLHQLFFFV